MSEAAEAVTETTTEVSEAPVVEAVEEAMPEFNLFEETQTDTEVTESDGETEAKETEVAEKPPAKERTDWSAKVRKDRQQRQKEIDLKRKELELNKRVSQFEGIAATREGARKALVSNPDEYFKSLGLDPFLFYQEWTDRLATGRTDTSEKMQNSVTKSEVNDLRNELHNRDKREKEQREALQNSQLVREFHGKIDEFKASTDKYPLTSTQCSAQNIAEAMSAYYQKTGVELTFDEAFNIVEQGLVQEEQKLFEDPEMMARFKKHHGLEDAAKEDPGRTASKTLSSKMAVAPTKQAPEDMTHEEIIRHWSGKIYI